MSRWGLTYKGLEIVTPEDWNAIVDALNDLDERVKGGKVELTGDGTTTTFQFTHGLGTTPTTTIVGKASPNLPDIDYWTADETHITVTFKTPPPATTFQLWWIALKPPTAP